MSDLKTDSEPILKQFTVKYFAILQEQSEKSEEHLALALTSYRDLYLYLAEKYKFNLTAHQIKVAVNDEFSDLDGVIQDHDLIVFIPPVAGG